jgi:hypothetical protein
LQSGTPRRKAHLPSSTSVGDGSVGLLSCARVDTIKKPRTTGMRHYQELLASEDDAWKDGSFFRPLAKIFSSLENDFSG